MKFYLKIFLILTCMILARVLSVAAATQETFYKYGHNDAEYSIMLPEAPLVETIWGDGGKVIPYLDKPPKEGALGEIATFHRVDLESEDSFEAKITFLKAENEFLDSLTPEKMRAALEIDYIETGLTQAKFDYTASQDNVLKWATVSGFSIDRSSRPYYNVAHYLTGQKSIMVIKVRYSVENKTFDAYFKKLSENIKYQAP